MSSDDTASMTPSSEAMVRLEMSPADLARFLAKIDTSGACWRWTGSNNGNGYGQFHKPGSDGRRQRYAHRFAYELFVGPIPSGMTLDHTCERGAEGCVTPAHLRPISMTENILASTRSPLARKARQTHCLKGHPLAGDNLYIQPSTGRRGCHICRAGWRKTAPSRSPERLRQAAREYAARKKAESAS